ncbi:bactericidal permeability increasing protein [Elysia marginata]|uniref:Bactericidal permeability increasing protein n=1 Tax=Elysia marginata TaxID=1093978 RepID=A0AAV4JQE0_9GAST|nr:bactericidal permeability increasing protein [Elysia marginata]
MSNVLVFSTVSASVANDFMIDYRLMSNPKVTSSYMETGLKGAVYSKSRRREPPLTAQAIPPVNYNGRMLYVWLTQYSFNTLMYQMHTSGMLRYQIAKAQLPSRSQSYLDTTCTSICVGRALLQVGLFHSRKTVELSVQSTAMPEATMTNNRINIVASVKIQAGIRSTRNTLSNLFSLTVRASTNFNPRITRENLNGKITGFKLELSNVRFGSRPPIRPTTINDQAPAYLQHFTSRVLPILQQNLDTMLTRTEASHDWTNNNCESMNHTLKMKIDWRPQAIPQLIDSIHEIVKGYYTDVERAIMGRGQYRLHEDF